MYTSRATCEVYFGHLWNLRKSAGLYVKLSIVHLLMRVDLTQIPPPFWDSTLRVPPAFVAGCLRPADISPCHPAGRSDRQRSPGAAAPRALLEKGCSSSKHLMAYNQDCFLNEYFLKCHIFRTKQHI